MGRREGGRRDERVLQDNKGTHNNALYFLWCGHVTCVVCVCSCADAVWRRASQTLYYDNMCNVYRLRKNTKLMGPHTDLFGLILFSPSPHFPQLG